MAEEETPQPRSAASSRLQLLTLILLCLTAVLVVNLNVRIHELQTARVEMTQQAYLAAPIPDLGINGRITAVDPAGNSFQMVRTRTDGVEVNRTINVNDDTIIRVEGVAATINDLKVGHNIRIRGLMDSEGAIWAHFVNAQPPAG